MLSNSSVEVLCGIVERRDHKVIRIFEPKATLRLVTDDEWTEEGFELTVRPGKSPFTLSVSDSRHRQEGVFYSSFCDVCWEVLPSLTLTPSQRDQCERTVSANNCCWLHRNLSILWIWIDKNIYKSERQIIFAWKIVTICYIVLGCFVYSFMVKQSYLVSLFRLKISFSFFFL